MATSDFDVELFERRLHTLKDSQESIQGLSAWCLERRQHHKKIVATWLQVLKKGESLSFQFTPQQSIIPRSLALKALVITSFYF